MASVSTLLRNIGAAMPRCTVILCIALAGRCRGADKPVAGRGRDGRRAGEMGAGAGALSSFKVPIGAGDHPCTGTEGLPAGIKAHGATGFPPGEACCLEDFVEALGLGG